MKNFARKIKDHTCYLHLSDAAGVDGEGAQIGEGNVDWGIVAEKMNKYWLPWLVGMPAESSLALCSLIFGGVFERLPKLRVAIAHAGGSFPATLGRIQHGFDVRPDLCAIDNSVPPTNYAGKFWIDSLTHDQKMLDYVVDMMGENRVCLGTDYPFPLGELEPGKLIQSMNWSDRKKEMLLSESALQWLNMPKNSICETVFLSTIQPVRSLPRNMLGI